MGTFKINSAYSAQPSLVKPNPFLPVAIEYIFKNGLISKVPSKIRVADQGCGKLRHLKLLTQYFDHIYLIDTEFQLSRPQKLFGKSDITIKGYVDTLNIHGKEISVVSDVSFNSTRLNLDIVFNICVFDIEIPKVRKAISDSAYRNLMKGGLCIIIISRNDQSILSRCKKENKYLDGYAFCHHGTVTFYKNYLDTQPLIKNLARQGFKLIGDLSVYKQVCLITRKE